MFFLSSKSLLKTCGCRHTSHPASYFHLDFAKSELNRILKISWGFTLKFSKCMNGPDAEYLDLGKSLNGWKIHRIFISNYILIQQSVCNCWFKIYLGVKTLPYDSEISNSWSPTISPFIWDQRVNSMIQYINRLASKCFSRNEKGR